MVSILHGWEYGAKRAKMKWLSNRKFLQRRPETNPTYAGNTLRTMTTIFSNKGATPRMRGKAHEQRQNRRPSAEQPRMCGEYRSSAHSSTMDSGTPPRARGIVRVPAICTVRDRNNPAGAGNTWGEIGVRRLPGGSTPRMRGIRMVRPPRCFGSRVNPACAGNRLADHLVFKQQPCFRHNLEHTLNK